MSRKTLAMTMATLVALLLAGTALFAQATPERAAPRSRPSHMRSMSGMTDETFAKKAAEGGMAEVKLGQLAQDKGSSQAVKGFGSRMAQDHEKANDQLKSAASQANITLPDQLNERQEAIYSRLSKLSGAAFDRSYARTMVRDHEHDVAAFRREARDGKSDAIKSFASHTLSKLEEHLKLARRMQSEVGGGTHERHASGMGSNGAGQ